MRTFHLDLRVLIFGTLYFTAALSSPASKLSSEPSAFLCAYADTAIHWETWGDDAFARAKHEQKPVFLLIGAFTSELSRAMARQSFSNAETAAFLNDNFVCVLVDAKERPDVAALYQTYIQTVKQLSGVPLNIWLTPELKPFEGANYLPPTEEWGKEGFITTMKRVASAWKADPAAQRRKADEAIAAVVAAQAAPASAPAGDLAAETSGLLASATGAWRSRFDSVHGGFGDPPKYPEPELLRFMLRDAATRDMALATLRGVINGAIRDPLDGGFFHNSQSADWNQPYFQKTLADQARVALALLDAARASGDTRFADAAREALNYALGLRTPAGNDFAAAEDATSEDLTATYFWTVAEIQAVLGEDNAPEFCRVYGVTAAGNIPADAFPGMTTTGKNLLYRATPSVEPSADKSLAGARAKLLERRQHRPAPRRDDSATSGTHGIMLAALARAGQQLNEPRFVAAAKAEFAFIRDHLRTGDGGLRRLADRPMEAAPEDYAMIVDGLLTFSATKGDASADTLALAFVNAAKARYWDDAAGRYFSVRPGSETGLWARVHSPTPVAGDPPSADAAMLTAISDYKVTDKTAADLKDKLARSIAADIKDAGDGSRGDLLLALQAAESR